MTPADVTYIRGQLGLSVAQLAERLGVQRSTVWRWERGLKPILPITELALSYLLVLDQQEDRERRIRAV